MFIRNCLTERKELVILRKKDTIGHAIEELQKYQLKSLPVTDDEDKFIGILSKEGLFELIEQGVIKNLEELKKQSIEEAISFISPLKLSNRFEETLPIIVRYPFVPIVDDKGTLLGIVKRQEITNALESSFGVGVSGVRLLLGTAEIEGRLNKIVNLSHDMHVNIITAVTFDAGEKFNRRILLKIEHTEQQEKFIQRLEKNGFTILTIHEE